MKHVIWKRAAAALLALALCAVPAVVWADGEASGASSLDAAQTVPAPAVLISRGEMPPIQAGAEGDVTFRFQNLGSVALQTPVATVSPSEGLTVSGTASSFALEEIPAGGAGSVKVRLRAADTASMSQSVTVELRYSYDAGGAAAQGTATDRLSIPVSARPAAVQPPIAVSRSAVTSPISPGEEFTIRLTFENRGSVSASGVSAVVTPSEALNILNETSTFQLPDLASGAKASADVRLRAAKEIASENQSLSVDLRFSYDSAGVQTAASQTDRINIPAKAASASSSSAQKTDAPVPNIVIKTFAYGGGTVAAGGRFPLSFTFENTGAVRCENIVVIVDGGESFTVDDGTNTAHYKALDAGKTQTQELKMQAIPAAKSGAQPVTVSFKYEYVDAGRRSPVTADVRLTIPVSQPDRFQISAPAAAPELEEGAEGEVMLSYVNKGKGDVANLEAELLGNGFDSPARTQYLGNVTAGGTGSIGFALTPEQAGELKLTVRITYEDADQQTQTKEIPLTVKVTEMSLDGDDFVPMEEPEKPPFPWVWLCVGGLALAACAAALVFVRRGKKRHAPANASDDWNWDDDIDGGTDP